jgi:acylpyruvate hydrolase
MPFNSTQLPSFNIRSDRRSSANSSPYRDHVAELKNTTPKQPFFFLKPTTSILPAHPSITGLTNKKGSAKDAPPSARPAILAPKGVNLHYEVELALIMGKDMKDYDGEGDWKEYVSGYAVGIDMSARNVQEEAKKKGLPWSIAKGFDTFLPISNIISPEQLPEPQNSKLWLSVNGEVRQDDSTALMLFPIPRILSEISKVMTLRKHDVVLTGTPKGVGTVVDGDLVKAGIKVIKEDGSDGEDIEWGSIEVDVKDSAGLYEFKET